MREQDRNEADASLGLREDFPVPTLDHWYQECIKLLKGAPFDRKMLTPTYEGITLQPMYTQVDVDQLTHVGGQPGRAPFVRGTAALGYRQRPWQVAQELPYPASEEYNAALRADLARGQTAAVLVIDRAGQAGLDPDEAPTAFVGKDGTSIASLAGLRRALAGVDLAQVPVHIESGSAALTYAALLVALAREQGVDPAALRGSVGLDPVAGLAEHGHLPVSLGQAYDELAAVTGWAVEHAPALHTVAAAGHVYHDGGASAVQELGITLAVAVHHLRELEQRGLDVAVTAPRIRFGFSVGTHFFLEIARLRAARLLWSRIVEATGADAAAGRMAIHARTSRFTKTALDPHVNLLRATTEAMAAIFGQVDSLHIAPFDEPLGLPDAFSRRIARNTHAMLREESHFDLVADPAGGSWCIETLTHQVAEAAWDVFQEIEAAGGVVNALVGGLVQRMVAETADLRRQALAHRTEVLVGANQYPNADEPAHVGRRVDHAAFQAERAAALERKRTEVDPADRERVMTRLAGLLESEEQGVFEAIVEAATVGATLGELSRTFRLDDEPRLAVEAIVAWRAGEMFEQLRSAVRDHADPRAVTVFCANLGNVARYMPRLDFTRGFFQTGGFRVVADRYFASVDEAAAAARLSGAGSAVIVGLDDTYLEQAAAAAQALKAAGVGTVLLAGAPGDHADEWRQAGVDEFINVRSDAHAVLRSLASSKGVAL
ncbi:MAG: acyl-CoA mutase large subunit family protein [Candidatus Krumholzibacteriia bacterium]